MSLTDKQIQKRAQRLRIKLKRKVKVIMPVRMGVSGDTLKAPEPVDEDLYTVRLEGFRPDATKNKTSINFNPQFRVISGSTTGGKFAGKNPAPFESLNQNAGWIQQDFVHACGMELEKDGDEYFMPGKWDGDPVNNPKGLKYSGPLVGKTLKIYVIKKESQTKKGSFFNVLKYYVCAIPDCNTKFPDVRHSTDLS